MHYRFKKWLLLTPVLVVASLLLLVWIADSWLESSGGRVRVESALEDALGMSVSLQGDFSINLLPDLGVTGGGLRIGDSGNNGFLLRCDSYHASISLWSLLRGELIVLAVRAADGEIDPMKMSAGDSDAPAQPFQLPRIDFLQLENFRIALTGGEGIGLELHRLELEGFEAERASPLTVDLSFVSNSESLVRVAAETTLMLSSGLEQVQVTMSSVQLTAQGRTIDDINGRLNWDLSGGLIETSLEAGDPVLGEANLVATFSTDPQSGTLAVFYTPQGRNQPAIAEVAFQLLDSGVPLSDIRLVVADQRFTGDGCWVSEPDPELHLELVSDLIDLDRLQAWIPVVEGGGDATLDLPFSLRAELLAAEVRSGDIIGHQVTLGAGDPPDCSVVVD